MRNISLTILVMLYFLGNTEHVIAQNKKDSLQRLRWIEGNWQGMDGNNPFYEIYKFKNDTVLQITSYNWNGTDSSGSHVSDLKRHNNAYYLGDSLNYKVISISDSSILMVPNYKAYNAIFWKKRDVDTWDAILETKTKTITYVMKRINHFSIKKKE